MPMQVICVRFQLISKPEANTEYTVGHARIFTSRSRIVCTAANLPFLLDPDVGRKLPRKFVTQAQAEFGAVEPGTDTQFGYVLRGQVQLGARLQDQALGNALVKFGFDTCRDVALSREESGSIDLEKVGCQSLDTDHCMGALRSGEVLTNACL